MRRGLLCWVLRSSERSSLPCRASWPESNFSAAASGDQRDNMVRFDEATEEFGPETGHVLGRAMDEAWRQVQHEYADESAPGAIGVIAEHILALARQGERDPKRLAEGALIRLSL